MAAAKVHISIVVYRGSPLDYPQYRHTALWLRFSDGSPALLAEITGGHGFFEYQYGDNADPATHQDFVRAVDVGQLSSTFTRASIIQTLSGVHVDNDDREYICQTWVQHALEMLKITGDLSEKDYERGVGQMVDAIAEAEDLEE
nr:hypothetical protein B0A51_02576 [Rachicladosporium sp. CCFEE 5018]